MVNSNAPAQNPNADHAATHPQEGPEVAILVDGKPIRIHRGHRKVVEIKTLAGVPLAYELEQILDGKLVPLPDDGAVTLKGDEKFVSHPKDGASS